MYIRESQWQLTGYTLLVQHIPWIWYMSEVLRPQVWLFVISNSVILWFHLTLSSETVVMWLNYFQSNYIIFHLNSQVPHSNEWYKHKLHVHHSFHTTRSFCKPCKVSKFLRILFLTAYICFFYLQGVIKYFPDWIYFSITTTVTS